MKLSEELQARGFVHQFTSESLAEILDGPKRTIYHGIDPSADSAHAGNMVIWLLLHHLAKNGHKIIFLVGGGTGMIGDPKPDSERVLQDEKITDGNVSKIQAQAQRLIGVAGNEVTFVNNKDWLSKIGLITFLRDIGKHFTVNELIKKDAISKRLESDTGISYTEFAYPLLQAYDYLELYKTMGCNVQVGGSDQWGNIVSGVDLIRRKEQQTVYALTVPLVVDKATGKKFGKSEGNAIWLDAEKTSPFVFFQFWFNTSDESVIDYLKLFTFLSLEEIREIEKEFSSNPSSRSAQKRLAHEVTTFVHGAPTTESVAKVTEILFGNELSAPLNSQEIEILKANAPTCEVSEGELILDILVRSKLASSKREARTFIESGAIEFANTKISDIEQKTETLHFAQGYSILKRGKKTLCVLTLA
jgi:tyrosyl-tRNA synthetase